ncbi:MAG: hypothetical protein ACFE9Q_03325 [Candidatus Hodarchaeota archaeon]
MKSISFGIFIVLIFFTSSLFFYKNSDILNQNTCDSKQNNDIGKNLKVSSIIGVINLTNYWIDGTRHYHNSTITIEGKIYKPIPPPPPYINLSGYNVAIVVNDILDTRYNATSDGFGGFQINYRIPFTLDVYSSHKIEVECIDNLGIDEIKKNNYFNIYVNATSVFDITGKDISPKIPGEDFRIEGFLKYDHLNGAGIPNVQINYNWFNSSYNWPSNNFFTNPSDGSFSQDIPIPTNILDQNISLNLSYSGDFPNIGNSEIITHISNLFSNITCYWNTIDKAAERESITIAGQIVSFSNNSLEISNRTLFISFQGTQIGVDITDSNGFFSYTYTVPPGIGIKLIEIDVSNNAGILLSSSKPINITGVSYTPTTPPELPPFLIFSLIFFPILTAVVAVLGVFGYRYYKKQEKESRVVTLPLESKIINLKILKDTGRLEESISYLFNAIYMDLINAKYNRTRKINETIRDFAIISVKELKLTPAAIYPFIQKVEEIIYAKPFYITEKDFYITCELFSPIYFQLTGFNFILNF